jgi:anti-sigma-K factor RskA
VSEVPRGDEHAQDLVAAYILGAVTPEEAALVQAHLLECDSCRRMAGELDSVVAQLPALAGERTPPPHLRARLMAIVSAEAQQAARPASMEAGETRPNGRHPDAPRPMQRRPQSSEPGPPAMTRRPPARAWHVPALFAAPRRLEGARAALVAVAALLVLALVGTGLWRLNGGGPPVHAAVYRLVAMGQPKVRGELRYVAATRRLALDLQGLRPLPAGRVYELWYIRGHYRLVKGVERFRPGADGRVRLSLAAEDPAHFTLVCLSVEGNAPARRPTMPLVAIVSPA